MLQNVVIYILHGESDLLQQHCQRDYNEKNNKIRTKGITVKLALRVWKTFIATYFEYLCLFTFPSTVSMQFNNFSQSRRTAMSEFPSRIKKIVTQFHTKIFKRPVVKLNKKKKIPRRPQQSGRKYEKCQSLKWQILCRFLSSNVVDRIRVYVQDVKNIFNQSRNFPFIYCISNKDGFKYWQKLVELQTCFKTMKNITE